MSNFLNKIPVSPITSFGNPSVPNGATFGTNFSILQTGGFMEVYTLSGLTYTIPPATTGIIEFSGNSIPIQFTKGSGSVFSPDVLTLNSDNISSGRRKLGMLAYVYETNKIYQFRIDNYDTLWNNATGATGPGGSTVVISDFGTTVKNNSSAGIAFINAWTSSTISGVGGYNDTNASWRVLSTGGSSGGTVSGNYLPLSGGTVSGATIFTNGLTANTISATTYYNLPKDIYVTGGTYSAGTAQFTNNTGDAFNVTGFSTGFGSNPGLENWYVNYGTVNNNGPTSIYFDTELRNYGSTQLTNDGTTWINNTSETLSFNVTVSVLWVGDGSIATEYINTLGIYHSTLIYVQLDSVAFNYQTNLYDGYASSVSADIILEPHESFGIAGWSKYNSTYNTAYFVDARLDIASLFVGEQGPQGIPGTPGETFTGGFVSGLTANTISATTYQNLPNTTFTGGTVSGATNFTNGLTANTISATTYQNLPNTTFTGGTVSGATNFTNGLTANTISATTYQNLPNTTGLYLPLSGGTVSGTTIIKINGTGFIIGTSNYTPGSVGNSISFATNTGITYSTINSRSIGGTSSGDLLLQNSGGNVSIGSNTSPNFKLDVGGSFGATSVSATTYLNLPNTTFTGGTVSGATNFTNGLTANTISATTYQNLPTDIRVTGGTYSNGTALFTNNTGGTFSVTGFSTGSTVTQGITGVTASNGLSATTSNNLTTIGFSGGNVNNSVNFTNGLTANTISATTLTIGGNSSLNGGISSNSLSGTTDRIVQVNSGGTVSASVQIITGYLTSGTTTTNLLDNTSNWDINGVYTGTTITGTYQGQKYYNGDYFFEAVADNLFIRLIRG